MKKGVTTKPKTKIIKCRDCGKEMEVPWKSKKILCEDCKVKSYKNHFKNVTEQKILCSNPKCSNVVRVIPKKGARAYPEIKGATLCDYCREHRPMKEREIRCPRCGVLLGKETLRDTYQLREVIYKKLCDSCREERKKEIFKSNSERMKTSNPMWNPETVDKVKETFKNKIESGELVYKRGRDHWLFKGNETFSFDVRSHLYSSWIKPILTRDEFKCTKCDSRENLQVHHIYPLRDIIRETLDELGMEESSASFTREDIGDELYEEALRIAIDKHKLEYGITLCKGCHEKEDYYYRPYKGKTKGINDEQNDTCESKKDYL